MFPVVKTCCATIPRRMFFRHLRTGLRPSFAPPARTGSDGDRVAVEAGEFEVGELAVGARLLLEDGDRLSQLEGFAAIAAVVDAAGVAAAGYFGRQLVEFAAHGEFVAFVIEKLGTVVGGDHGVGQHPGFVEHRLERGHAGAGDGGVASSVAGGVRRVFQSGRLVAEAFFEWPMYGGADGASSHGFIVNGGVLGNALTRFLNESIGKFLADNSVLGLTNAIGYLMSTVASGRLLNPNSMGVNSRFATRFTANGKATRRSSLPRNACVKTNPNVTKMMG